MTFCGLRIVLFSATFLVLLCPPLVFAGVQARFSLDSPAGGPFPSDQFTVAYSSHNTKRRVNLPIPDCAVRHSECDDLAVINILDGFNVEPRLSFPFDGPIDVTTVTHGSLFHVRLD